MFRSHTVNTRLFFTQPSLAFFDAMHFKPRRTVRLTAQNYISELKQHLRDDWVIVPQPRPPSPVYYLIVTKKGNKVVGRLRPPFCVPFPRKHAGFEKSNAGNDNNDADTRINKNDLIDFYHNHPGNGSSWLLACTDRAVGCLVMDKTGEIDGNHMINFSLL